MSAEPEKLRDLKFLELAPPIIPPWPHGITAPVCVAARDNFKANLRPAASLKEIVGASHRFGYDWRKAEEWAERGLKKMEEGQRKERIIAQKAWDKYMEKAPTSEDMAESNRRMDVMLQLKEIHETVERLMQGMCVLAWTAVEVFLHDLLTGSIDAHKALLTKHPSFGIKPEVKARMKYLGWFEHFYKDARVIAAIQSDDIYALGAIRHAIVHRAAYMDESFMREVNGDATKGLSGCKILKVRYPNLKPPAPTDKWPTLDLDGGFVFTMIEGAIKACFDLLQAVNKWEEAQQP